MRCKYWQKQIMAAIDNMLSPDAEIQLQRHMQMCPHCTEMYTWQKVIHEALQQELPVKAPSDFNQLLWQRIETVSLPKRIYFRWAPAAVSALAFAAVAAALVVTYQLVQKESIPQVAQPPVMADKFEPEKSLPVQTQPLPGDLAQKKSKPKLKRHHRKQVVVQEPAEIKVQDSEVISSVEKSISQTPVVPRVVKEDTRQYKQNLPQRIRSYTFSLPCIRNKKIPASEYESRAKKAVAAGTVHSSRPVYRTQALSQVRLLNNKIYINQHDRTRLEFVMDQSGHVRATIYSREGRVVKKLLDQDLPAGLHAIEWNGTTDSGIKVASGIYVLVLSGDIQEKRFKIAVIK